MIVMRWRGISQRRLAKLMGMHRSTMGRRFRPGPEPWTVAELAKLAVILRVPVGLFFLAPGDTGALCQSPPESARATA